MITKEQAIQAGERKSEFHNGLCKLTIGPRGGQHYDITVYRANGKCKTWKTRPNDFRLPIKYGFYGPCDYITSSNAYLYHLSEDCPIWQSEQYKNLLKGGE